MKGNGGLDEFSENQSSRIMSVLFYFSSSSVLLLSHHNHYTILTDEVITRFPFLFARFTI